MWRDGSVVARATIDASEDRHRTDQVDCEAWQACSDFAVPSSVTRRLIAELTVLVRPRALGGTLFDDRICVLRMLSQNEWLACP